MQHSRIPKNHVEWRLTELIPRSILVNNLGQCMYAETGRLIPLHTDKRGNVRGPRYRPNWGDAGRYTHISIRIPRTKAHGPQKAYQSRTTIVRSYSVSRLVAHAFLGPAPADKQDVNHKDENTLNNTVWLTKTGRVIKSRSNLEWSNHILNGLHSAKLHPGRYTLTPQLVRKIRRMRAKTGWGSRKIAKALNLPLHNCIDVIYDKSRSHQPSWSWVDAA